jgi:vacuolar-type H+-ATPase subunit H
LKVIELLEEMEDIVEGGSTIPFAQKVLVDRGELLELIREIRILLPDEIKQAQWIKEERQKILSEAQNEADIVLKEANNHIVEMIDQDEITKLANDNAQKIIFQAKTTAKEMRIGAKEYTDELLQDAEEYLLKLTKTLKNNREELKEMK